MTTWLRRPGTIWAALAAGALLLPLAGRADKEEGAPPEGPTPEIAEAAVQEAESSSMLEISDREPWNEQPEPMSQGVTVQPSNKWQNVDVPPAALGPAADGTLSVLVHLDPGMDLADRSVSPARVGLRNFVQLRQARIQYEYDILPNVVNVRGLTPAAVEELKQLRGVQKVEPDAEVFGFHNDSIPLIRARQDQLQGAGITATGAGTRICIIDTGIDSNSIMYSGRIDTAAGWDFVNNDSNPEDDNGHGSHVAGTALGGTGVTADFGCVGPESMQGVAPQATLIGVKVLAANGSGSTSNVIAGINRCASATLPGGPADVINLSLGSGQFTSTCDTNTTAIAVNNAANAGVVVVAAAGNNGYTNAVSSPACASGAIAVAAIYDDTYPSCEFPTQTSFQFCLDSFCLSTCTDNNPVVNQRVCFSNRSAKLDVAAPGCIIFSDDSTVAGGNGLIGFCGTSQAAPHVAGLAALILDEDPSLTPANVRQLIRDGAVDLGAAGFDTNFGFGRIDAINSLQLASPGCTTNPQCDDGVFCNGAETCVAGSCQGGTAPCTGQLCRESDDTCVNCLSDANCDDGLFCNGAETCNASGNCVAGSDPCGGQPCDEGTNSCVGGEEVWLSFIDSASVPSVGTVENEDIVARNVSSGAWSLIFDGSDVGLSGFVIDGMAVQANGDILLSFTASGSVAGMTGGPSGTTLDDSDIVRFVPTSLGSTTAGSFVFYFDGSDVGLTTDNEDIDAIALDSDGSLIISTVGTVSATGASGVGQDLLRFTATALGSVTTGSFAIYFDGSDVALSATAENIDGASRRTNGNILLSTTGNFSVTGASGANEDIFNFAPTQLGGTTSGTYSMYLDLSTVGIATGEDVGSVELVP